MGKKNGSGRPGEGAHRSSEPRERHATNLAAGPWTDKGYENSYQDRRNGDDNEVVEISVSNQKYGIKRKFQQEPSENQSEASSSLHVEASIDAYKHIHAYQHAGDVAERAHRDAQSTRASKTVDIKILRQYVLPHLEQLCKDFLQSVIINNAREIKISSLEIKDKDYEKIRD